MLDWWIGLTVVPVYEAYQSVSRLFRNPLLAAAWLAGIVVAGALLVRTLRHASGSRIVRWLVGAVLRLCGVAAGLWFVAYSTLTGALAVWRGPFQAWFATGWTGWLAAVLLLFGAALWFLVALRMLGVALRTLFAIGRPPGRMVRGLPVTIDGREQRGEAG